jgi:hypothetical protein
MDAEAAAQALLRQLDAPSWAISIWPWSSQGKVILRVMVDASYKCSIDVPTEFAGFEVWTELRSANIAL